MDPSPRTFAENIALKYFDDHYLKHSPRTISVMDLSKTRDVITAFNDLMIDLLSKTATLKTYVRNARIATQKFDSQDYYTITNEDEFLDLVDFCQKIYAYVPDSKIQSEAQTLQNILANQFIVANHFGSGNVVNSKTGIASYMDMENAHGVSFYFPYLPDSRLTSDYQLYITHKITKVTVETTWDEFFVSYFSSYNWSPIESSDPGIPPVLRPWKDFFIPFVSRW